VKVAVIVGTRPEIIKMSPVIRELANKKIDYFILHTGQHYSYNLDKIFFEQLRLPHSKYNLRVGSGSHAEETAKILVGVENILQKETPDIVLVEGDTSSVFGSAVSAAKLHIKVGHVEAGLRSHDRQMPEEINRVLTDHCSDYLFAPTSEAEGNLLNEGIPKEKIFVTGNTIVDAVNQNLEMAQSAGNILNALNHNPKTYCLVTLHRQENVDNLERFKSILEGLNKIAFDLPVIYPIHPRSRKMLVEHNLRVGNIGLIEPIGFLEFLQLESQAKLVLTDSGGCQEESCILSVPCVTLRDNTERPETIDVGANILAGANPEKILECANIMLNKDNHWVNPFGDGRAGERIVEILTYSMLRRKKICVS